jgi:hypothetical protein
MAKNNKNDLVRRFFNMLFFAMLFLGPIILAIGLIFYFLIYNYNYSIQLLIVPIILAIGFIGYFINAVFEEGALP